MHQYLPVMVATADSMLKEHGVPVRWHEESPTRWRGELLVLDNRPVWVDTAAGEHNNRAKFILGGKGEIYGPTFMDAVRSVAYDMRAAGDKRKGMLRRNGSKFEALVDQLPEVNEHTVFAMILAHLPPPFHARLQELKPAILPMIEQKLVAILQAKVQAILAAT